MDVGLNLELFRENPLCAAIVRITSGRLDQSLSNLFIVQPIYLPATATADSILDFPTIPYQLLR